ncbi:MAG: GTP cyclohydrolase II [Inquilinus sp.]|nr:GTP cyclohydrolase II [Inquilinus sp.]
MTTATDFAPAPPALRQVSLRAVDRACGDLRRGDVVLVRPDSGPALLVQASESVTPEAIERMTALTGRAPAVAITRQRSAAIGLEADGDGVLLLEPGPALSAGLVRMLADPEAAVDPTALADLPRRRIAAAARDGAVAATRLTKLARLLPAALVAPVERPLATDRLVAANDILSVSAFDIDHYELHAARGLHRVAEAAVPLDGAEATRIVAFRPTDGGQEHLAIVIGTPDPAGTPLIRLHSECFTGDLLGSLRCDCGQQLRGAIAEIAREGSGALLYLAQEGRGIGLVNKLRAYRLQDADFDTVDANVMLGYDADERLYQPAAEMLRQLGFARIRLLTNNPDKVAGLADCGIEIAERVPHAFPANGHNEFYLRTKKTRSGHLL